MYFFFGNQFEIKIEVKIEIKIEVKIEIKIKVKIKIKDKRKRRFYWKVNRKLTDPSLHSAFVKDDRTIPECLNLNLNLNL